ncbi:P44/Msp2 family outer membrane protein [Wolbachia endosymbiont of Litomosoides brasiliensis]|uniref:P44/Msp2 family outer membrane protein n=1 Tax=Wolbachia endosymbiont of Litomosoides brasiliensis TaxID=1812117 RepID=UPI00158D706B|nr:P44/Msp2 family outer membrane protein [Wolbachia endosymbiont of Litomosoides brasiliensis]NUY39647.1 P44/Msp2 family outer membrane protein [Wolbachia endosymbiont of Litomosoides brasiliensis]
MYYKKFFSATALVTLLSLSNSAFSDLVGPIADEETSYYIRLQYNGEFSPLNTKVDGIIGAQKDSKDTNDLYKPSFMAGGGAFGYKMDDIRVDIEGLYSQLGKDTLSRAPTPDIVDDLTAISGLVNVYYDIAIEDMPIIPYISVGLGAAYVSNPAKAQVVADQKRGFGFAYQAKAGVSYNVTPEIKLFAGARYFGSYGASFDKSETVNKKASEDKKIEDKETKVTAGAYKVLYSTIGAEAGIAFNF